MALAWARDKTSRLKVSRCPETIVTNKTRGFGDRKALLKDIEYLIPKVVESMCWAYLRVFARPVGLKTKIGGRTDLTQRIEEFRINQFHIGKLITEHRDWFLKPMRGEPV